MTEFAFDLFTFLPSSALSLERVCKAPPVGCGGFSVEKRKKRNKKRSMLVLLLLLLLLMLLRKTVVPLLGKRREVRHESASYGFMCRLEPRIAVRGTGLLSGSLGWLYPAVLLSLFSSGAPLSNITTTCWWTSVTHQMPARSTPPRYNNCFQPKENTLQSNFVFPIVFSVCFVVVRSVSLSVTLLFLAGLRSCSIHSLTASESFDL